VDHQHDNGTSIGILRNTTSIHKKTFTRSARCSTVSTPSRSSRTRLRLSSTSTCVMWIAKAPNPCDPGAAPLARCTVVRSSGRGAPPAGHRGQRAGVGCADHAGAPTAVATQLVCHCRSRRHLCVCFETCKKGIRFVRTALRYCLYSRKRPEPPIRPMT